MDYNTGWCDAFGDDAVALIAEVSATGEAVTCVPCDEVGDASASVALEFDHCGRVGVGGAGGVGGVVHVQNCTG